MRDLTNRLVIRRLEAAETAALRRLNALFAEAFEDYASYASAPPDDAYLARILRKEHVAVLVAESEGELLGGLVAYEFDKLEQARRELYIYDLAVRADRRREGIATALIEHLREIAAERGAWVIFVQGDHGDDPAIALYEKLGTREDVMHFDIAVPPRPGLPGI